MIVWFKKLLEVFGAIRGSGLVILKQDDLWDISFQDDQMVILTKRRKVSGENSDTLN